MVIEQKAASATDHSCERCIHMSGCIVSFIPSPAADLRIVQDHTLTVSPIQGLGPAVYLIPDKYGIRIVFIRNP